MRTLRDEIAVMVVMLLIAGAVLYFGLPALITWSERIRVRATVSELRSLGVLPDSSVVRVHLEDARH